MRLQRPRRVRGKDGGCLVCFLGRGGSGPITAANGEIGSAMVCSRGLVCVCSRLWGDRSARAFVRGGKARGGGCRRRVGGWVVGRSG